MIFFVKKHSEVDVLFCGNIFESRRLMSPYGVSYKQRGRSINNLKLRAAQ